MWSLCKYTNFENKSFFPLKNTISKILSLFRKKKRISSPFPKNSKNTANTNSRTYFHAEEENEGWGQISSCQARVDRYKKRFLSGSAVPEARAQWGVEFKLKCLWTEHELA